MSQIIAISEKHIKPVIEQLGFEVVEIEYKKKYDRFNLTFYIDIPRGVNLDDCEMVHNTISPILDELDPTGDTPYVLNVSSPGLDRQFKTQRDFERNYNREVEIKLFAPIKGKKIYEGTLLERAENTTTIIDNKDTEIKIENSKIAYVRPLVKFDTINN